MTFTQQLKLSGDAAMKAVEEKRRAIAIGWFSGTILATPVDSGRLRGNWRTSLGAPVLTTTDRTDKSGIEVLLEMQSNIGDGLKKDIVAYMTNNLPYAYRIEYEGWSHTKAPQGMVRINFDRITQLIRFNKI